MSIFPEVVAAFLPFVKEMLELLHQAGKKKRLPGRGSSDVLAKDETDRKDKHRDRIATAMEGLVILLFSSIWFKESQVGDLVGSVILCLLILAYFARERVAIRRSRGWSNSFENGVPWIWLPLAAAVVSHFLD